MKNNIKLMTYEEWENLYGGKLKDGPFMSAKDKAADFLKLHDVDIYDEIYKINKKEYKLYLEMVYVDNEEGEIFMKVDHIESIVEDFVLESPENKSTHINTLS